MTKDSLKKLAIASSLFSSSSLGEAVEKLGFVQIDPIRVPARAQDLIIRHRVSDYRAGALEKQYGELAIEEDYLYAHGFIPHQTWKLLHPRSTEGITAFDAEVLAALKNLGPASGKMLEPHFAQKSVTNWWGGSSRASSLALDRLHYYGLVRVAGRINGSRIYEALPPQDSELSLDERLEKIIIAVVAVLSPVTLGTLRQALQRIRAHFGNTSAVIARLLKDGRLEKYDLDGISYIVSPHQLNQEQENLPDKVWFLAPFDPLIWDRRKFEHLWGWQYRFEAYTPAQKRIRGYYAMPVLWRGEMVGWVNAKKVGQKLVVEAGFVGQQPKDPAFREAFDLEVQKFKVFLGLI